MQSEKTVQLIEKLNLSFHEEGGYFNETFRSEEIITTNRDVNNGERRLATCIYYMLTNTAPLGYFHSNMSPILHFHHAGGPMIYRFIHGDGRIEEHVMGQDIANGQVLQLVAPAGCWKSTQLAPDHEYGLVSEVVFPGWELFDSIIAKKQSLLDAFPQHAAWINAYSYN